MKKGFSSTLSPHAQPYFPSLSSSSSSSSIFLPTTGMYSTSSHVQPAPSPSSTLQNLQVQIASSKLSSDDIDDSLIDSPCYKGRNWSPITFTPLLHMGQTSPPPRVTVNKLAAEEHNISAAVTTIASLMVSHEKQNGFSSLPVSVGFLDHPPHDNPANQIFDPGFKREGILQTIVDLSNMLLQIPLNAADLSESYYEMVYVIIKDLKKLQEEYQKGYIRKFAEAYRSDEEKSKTNTCSALCSQPRVFPLYSGKAQPVSHNFVVTSSSMNIASQIFLALVNFQNCYIDDNVDNIEATVCNDLRMSAKIEKHEMEYKLQHARMAVDTETNN